MHWTLTISTERKHKKGRSFSAHALAYAVARCLVGAAPDGTERPLFLWLATTEGEARALLENLRAGERAVLAPLHGYASSSSLELLRSLGYAFHTARTEDAVLITAHLPKVFDFQPGLLDPDGVGFVLMPAEEDLGQIAITDAECEDVLAHVERLGFKRHDELWTRLPRLALMWAAYLDERSELPIPPAPDFRAELCLAALSAGLATLACESDCGSEGLYENRELGFRTYVAPGLPLARGILTKATHEELGELLQTELRRYEDARARRANAQPKPRAIGHAARALREHVAQEVV